MNLMNRHPYDLKSNLRGLEIPELKEEDMPMI